MGKGRAKGCFCGSLLLLRIRVRVLAGIFVRGEPVRLSARLSLHLILASDGVLTNVVPYLVAPQDGETDIQTTPHPICEASMRLVNVKHDTIALQLASELDKLLHSWLVGIGRDENG